MFQVFSYNPSKRNSWDCPFKINNFPFNFSWTSGDLIGCFCLLILGIQASHVAWVRGSCEERVSHCFRSRGRENRDWRLGISSAHLSGGKEQWSLIRWTRPRCNFVRRLDNSFSNMHSASECFWPLQRLALHFSMIVCFVFGILRLIPSWLLSCNQTSEPGSPYSTCDVLS